LFSSSFLTQAILMQLSRTASSSDDDDESLATFLSTFSRCDVFGDGTSLPLTGVGNCKARTAELWWTALRTGMPVVGLAARSADAFDDMFWLKKK
jgi:hypothetical protein